MDDIVNLINEYDSMSIYFHLYVFDAFHRLSLMYIKTMTEICFTKNLFHFLLIASHSLPCLMHLYVQVNMAS